MSSPSFGNAELFRGLWDQGEALARLNETFPELEIGEYRFREELTLLVPAAELLDVLAFLRDDPACSFNFLTDVTAVHWPQRERPFDAVYLLYSMERNKRLRIKVELAAEPSVASVTPLWPTADWLERECYDMFGIQFEGHPDLRRILLEDGFEGHPLLKEFPLKC